MHNTIFRWAHNLGPSSWRFYNKMLDNIDLWENIEISNLKEVIALTKKSSISHYALIPFFIKYVGINIGCLYPELMFNDKWSKDEIYAAIEILSYPANEVHHSNTLDALGYSNIKSRLRKIRKRLIDQGVHDTRKIRINYKDSFKWVNFNHYLESDDQ